MKILVCTDGSEHGLKAVEKAALIAGGNKDNQVTVLHVDEGRLDLTSYSRSGKERTRTVSVMTSENIKKMQEEDKAQREKILQEALEYLKNENIKADKILKEGYPSLTIVKVAAEESFDMIVIGSRGLSGFKKVFLGSTSNAVVQEAKDCIVSVVK